MCSKGGVTGENSRSSSVMWVPADSWTHSSQRTSGHCTPGSQQASILSMQARIQAVLRPVACSACE
jgi:hypothetical protein